MNSVGINLGDRYEVLSDVEIAVVTLPEDYLGMALDGCPELSMCGDYRIELVTAFGTLAKKAKLLSYFPPYVTFIFVD
jgi:hypothetical protein